MFGPIQVLTSFMSKMQKFAFLTTTVKTSQITVVYGYNSFKHMHTFFSVMHLKIKGSDILSFRRNIGSPQSYPGKYKYNFPFFVITEILIFLAVCSDMAEVTKSFLHGQGKTGKGRHENKGICFIMRRTWFFSTKGSKMVSEQAMKPQLKLKRQENSGKNYGKDKSIADTPAMNWTLLKTRCDYFSLQNHSLRQLERKKRCS